MPTIQEVIDRTMELRPDAVPIETKSEWLSSLDKQIYQDVIVRHKRNAGEEIVTPAENEFDSKLIVESPYDDLYDEYLFARIDYANREYESYNNEAMIYSETLQQYKDWYNRTHMPLQIGEVYE